MFHGLDNQFLYAAYKIDSTFANNVGESVTCSGTGFWIRNDDLALVLVTNRHMVDIEFASSNYLGYTLRKLVVSGKISDENGLPNIDQQWTLDHPRIKYPTILENDIACLIEPDAKLGRPGLSRIDYWIPRDLLANKEDFKARISICDFVAFPGFPEWHDRGQNRPILRTGSISSDPRYDYSWSEKYHGECMAYEAFSYGGSSGSPVFAVQKGPRPGVGISFPGFRDLKLVGINAGHLRAAKDSHSGISYMFKSSAILETIDS